MPRFLPLIPVALLLALASAARASAGTKPLAQLTRVQVAGQSSRAEITVRQGPIDLADLAITDLEGEPTPLADTPRTLATGAVVHVLWPKAADAPAGAVRVTSHVLASTDDQLELLLRGEPHDAVAWSNQDGTVAKAEQTDRATLVEQGMWEGAGEAEAVRLVGGGSIVRGSPVDTDRAADWRVEDGASGAGGGSGSKPPAPSTKPRNEPLPSSGPADVALLTAAGALLLRSCWGVCRGLLRSGHE